MAVFGLGPGSNEDVCDTVTVPPSSGAGKRMPKPGRDTTLDFGAERAGFHVGRGHDSSLVDDERRRRLALQFRVWSNSRW